VKEVSRKPLKCPRGSLRCLELITRTILLLCLAGLLVGETILFCMFMWTYIKVTRVHHPPGITDIYESTSQTNRLSPLPLESLRKYVKSMIVVRPHRILNLRPSCVHQLVPEAPPPGHIVDHGGQLVAGSPAGDHDGHGLAPGPLDAGRNLWPAEVPLPGFLRDENGVAEGARLSAEVAQESAIPSSASVEYANAWKQRNSGYGSDIARSSSNPFDARDDVHQVESRESGIPLASTSRNANGVQIGSGYSHADDQFQANGEIPPRPFPQPQYERAYCQYCRIYKPWRSHHCRICGKCVLAME